MITKAKILEMKGTLIYELYFGNTCDFFRSKPSWSYCVLNLLP